MTRKIAISVRDELLQAVDAESRREGVSRSAVFAEAAADYVRRKRRLKADEEYAQSFRDAPETDEEMAELDAWAHDPSAWEDDEW